MGGNKPLNVPKTPAADAPLLSIAVSPKTLLAHASDFTASGWNRIRDGDEGLAALEVTVASFAKHRHDLSSRRKTVTLWERVMKKK